LESILVVFFVARSNFKVG